MAALTPQKEQAAVLVHEDRLTDEQIASELGVSRKTLSTWKTQPTFRRRVDAIRQEFAHAIVAEGIANKQNRIDRLNHRAQLFDTIIADRASDPEMQTVPGGATGMMLGTSKISPTGAVITDYAPDYALSKEMRDTEKQVAIELGQWTEKKDVTSGGKSIDEALNAILDRVVRFVVPDEHNPFADGG